MVIKAVLFDMDGTIIDSEDVHTRSLQEVVKENIGLEIPKEEIEKYIGLSYTQKLEKIFKERNVKKDYHKLSKFIRERNVKLSNLVKKIDSTEEVIKMIKEKFKIALVTASSKIQAEAMLKSSELKKYFELIITSDEVENNKPHPDCYLLASKKLKVKPKECVVIEDSVTGVEAAKSAGMFCIAVRNKYNKDKDFSEADLVVENLKNIDLDMIKKIG